MKIEPLSNEVIQQLHNCLDNLPIAVTIQRYQEDEQGRPDFQPVYANNMFVDSMGVPEEVVYNVPLRIASPNFPEQFFQDMKKIALDGEQLYKNSFPTPMKRYFEVSIDQYCYGYLKMCLRDITNEHVGNDTLSSIAYAYQEIIYVNAIEDVVYQIYPEVAGLGHMVTYEEKGRQTLAEGKIMLSDIGFTEEQFLSLEYAKRSLGDKDFFEGKQRMKNAKGEYEWCSVSIIVNERIDGEISSFIMAIKNIDQLLKEEERKQKQLEELMQKEKYANEAKNRLLANMSHDFRTPLNGIFGMLNLMEKNEEDIEKQREYRNTIRRTSEFLLSMFTDMLEMTRIEVEGIKEEIEEFDIRDIIHEIERVTQSTVGKIEIMEPKLLHPFRKGYPIYIRQILFHLFENAIKFNKPDGKVTFWMDEIFEGKQTPAFAFYVKDTGIGIGEDFLPHIFEAFAQEHGDARTTYAGTGLGLAHAKKIIDLLGGTIEVESKVGVGSTFTVTIPMEIATDLEEREREEIECNKQEVILAGKKVLLVEDNELNLYIAECILEEEDMIVETAENGKIAVEKFKASKPDEFDLVLMDIMMPVMNGLEASRAIRDLDREDAKKVPILAVSANAFPEDIQKSLDAGMNAHVAKPINAKIIVQAIKDNL